MTKWKLLLSTLPFVLVAVGLKLGLHYGLEWQGLMEFSDVGVVLTGGVFLIGFMLAGVMADYKESEKLPAEVACQLETIEETFAQAAAGKQELDGAALRRSVLAVTDSIGAWLRRQLTHAEMFAALERLTEEGQRIERAGATPIGVRVLNEVSYLRKAVTRVGVISRTGFLSSGYALLECLTAMIVGLMVLARFKSVVAEAVIVGFVTLVFVYMVRLIRDIDDPFEYSANGAKGAAEVELFPLEEYRQRLAARCLEASSSAAEQAKPTPTPTAATTA